MSDFQLLKDLHAESASKIVLLVLDGLGGLPLTPGGKTELESAVKPNLDALAAAGSLGLTDPVGTGITPGSGPGHLALFGYDPLVHVIGRGVLEALGIAFPLQESDLAARGNFCTVDAAGDLTDRRAGRIPTTECARLCQMLRQIQLPGIRVFVEPVQDYRFVLVLRGPGLSEHISETDPQRLGVAPLPATPLQPEAGVTAGLVNDFIAQARRIIGDQHPANMLMLRGFSQHPQIPRFSDVYGLRPAAVAVYPMYKGLARLVGMELIDVTAQEPGMPGKSPADEFAAVAAHWQEHDFFYVHIKGTDSAGEDGDFVRKASVIEEVDRALPALLALKPDVLMVAGDHSTPALLKAHSWHPVPFLLSAANCRPEGPTAFGERACARGVLGRFPAKQAMTLALGHAGRLAKYGA
jgi:2,3-bisphosphoglycerate-independent phosphoglycerate mutase